MRRTSNVLAGGFFDLSTRNSELVISRSVAWMKQQLGAPQSAGPRWRIHASNVQADVRKRSLSVTGHHALARALAEEQSVESAPIELILDVFVAAVATRASTIHKLVREDDPNGDSFELKVSNKRKGFVGRKFVHLHFRYYDPSNYSRSTIM